MNEIAIQPRLSQDSESRGSCGVPLFTLIPILGSIILGWSFRAGLVELRTLPHASDGAAKYVAVFFALLSSISPRFKMTAEDLERPLLELGIFPSGLLQHRNIGVRIFP
jgi:hypothetical protein